MTKERRKELNNMVNGLNDSFPSKTHGFEKFYTVKLVKNDIEIYKAEYKGKKIKQTKEVTAISPNGKSHYTWEDVLQAFLIGANVPIMIFRKYQEDAQAKHEENIKKTNKLRAEDEVKAKAN